MNKRQRKAQRKRLWKNLKNSIVVVKNVSWEAIKKNQNRKIWEELD